MRIRTVVGILFALAAVVLVSFLTQHNREILAQRFAVGDWTTVSLATVLVVVFLIGLLPPVTLLVIQHLKRELAERRERRMSRQEESRHGSFRRAVDFKLDGQWGKAAAELESVLADKPEDFAALLNYGEVLRCQGRAAEALEVHRRASVLYPQSVALLYQMADDYAEVGDEEVSREIRNRILRDFPGVGLAVQRRRRNHAMAEGDWREAARLQDSIEATLAENDAEPELERERRIRLGLDYQRGLARLEDERVAEAEEIFRRLLEEEPRFIPASIMLGEAALVGGADDAALEEWQRGYESTGSPVFLQRIEDHFIERAEPARAIETLHRIIDTADNDLLPRFYLGRLYYRLEMLDEAQRTLTSIADRVASSPTYHLLTARIHERRGELGRAVEAYLSALEQAGLMSTEYRCEACGAVYRDWRDRCDSCGAWNAVDLDFEEERLTPAELGIRERPVWSVTEEADDELGDLA